MGLTAEQMQNHPDSLPPSASDIRSLIYYDNDLWRKEALLVEEMTPEHGLKPDFYQICERAIMERFAAEEAMRAA